MEEAFDGNWRCRIEQENFVSCHSVRGTNFFALDFIRLLVLRMAHLIEGFQNSARHYRFRDDGGFAALMSIELVCNVLRRCEDDNGQMPRAVLRADDREKEFAGLVDDLKVVASLL